VLERLDEYEGCDVEAPAAGLYCRVKAPARLEDGQEFQCWMYAYHREVSASRVIENGRWR
jgi:gamma-glutamylcyclotransferase (GGCT)/AIG2-like uncharacterized protein YtfP